LTTHRTAHMRLLVAIAALSAALTLAFASGVAASPRSSSIAHGAANCSPPRYPGTGYFSSLSVSGASCSTGRKLVLAYYHCRLKHGAAGRCTSSVEGFRCSEKRQSIPTEVDARVTCTRRHEKVVHTYQQDL
jgi:hypothetical protein